MPKIFFTRNFINPTYQNSYKMESKEKNVENEPFFHQEENKKKFELKISFQMDKNIEHEFISTTSTHLSLY